MPSVPPSRQLVVTSNERYNSYGGGLIMQVFLHHIVEKYLERMNAADRGHIKAVLKDLEKEPPEGNIRPYEGNPGIWRLKVSGGHRALFKIENGTILVTHMEPRGQVYTKKTRNRRG